MKHLAWLRNRIDFVIYGIKIGKINPYILIVNLAILAYSLFHQDAIRNEESIVIILFLFFVNIVWQIFSTGQEYYLFTRKTKYYRAGDSKITGSFTLDKRVSDEYERLAAPKIGQVICSRRINSLLRGSTPIQMHPARRKSVMVGKYIRTYKELILPFLNYKWHQAINDNGLFYNENKLCMASEIERNGEAYAVKVCKGSYYDSFLTNNIYNMRMSHQNGLSIEPPFNAENYPIRAFDESLMNNHIGVSTLAVSKDGYAVLLRHNNRSAMFVNKLLPSGSGSVDYSDMKGQSDFRRCITRAAERELREETSIPKKMIVSSRVIGFYRDLNRGGKPEFCCLSLLDGNKYELTEHIRPNNSEQRDDFQFIKLFEQGRFVCDAFEEFDFITSDDCSLSLFMNLYLLRDYCDNCENCDNCDGGNCDGGENCENCENCGHAPGPQVG